MGMADAAISSVPFVNSFDTLDFGEDFPSGLTQPPDIFSDLVYDDNIEFSIEDLLSYPDADLPSENCSVGGCAVPEGLLYGSESKKRSGVSSSSLVPGDGASDHGTSLALSGNSATSSPRSGDYDSISPTSGNMASADAALGATEVNFEEERKGLGSKRKKEMDDGYGNCEVNPNGNGYVRSSKCRRPGHLDEANSPCLSNAENDDDEKRKARLVRNRESAQLSRQRKKHYVEELEGKVRSMHSLITDLNGKISYFMAENASLRQQLGGNGGKCPPPSIYPVLAPMVPMPYAWIPCSNYAMRPPMGSHVPLVPIPKLKPQQSTSNPKVRKTDGKKAESKTNKKIACVSLLGLLAFIYLVAMFAPGVEFREGKYEKLISYGYNNSRSRILDQSRGRILSVSVNISKHKPSDHADLCGQSAACGKKHIYKFNIRSESGLSRNRNPKRVSQPSANLDRSSTPGNANQPLLASLYVPRNDKLVKIDGNLIISSVLASERAAAQTEYRSYKTTQSPTNKNREPALAISQSLGSSLAIHKLGKDAERKSRMYRSPNQYQKALPHGFAEMSKDNPKATLGDGSLKEWFREGLEGSVFNSGICTEVFQYNVASASGGSGGIISATSMVNAGNTDEQNSTSMKMKNRRILYSPPIHLSGSIFNGTEEGYAKPPENSSFDSKSMVVSVLVDPRETGGGDGDGMINSKSISRIFVVVLVDSVKYVTYSCGLPFKSSAPHLATN